MTDTFISVLMPVRNAATTLPDALSGLVAEPDSAREVLVIDDGSVDATWPVLCAWAARDTRIRPLRASGSGLVDALRQAAGHARGGLLARMDGDDIAHPERLSRQRAALGALPEVCVVGTRVEAFTDGDAPLGEGMARYVAWQNGLVSPAEHARERFVESPLCHPSVMMRRAAYDAVGGYRAFDGPEDYDLFLRLGAVGGLAKLPEVLLRWRHHGARTTFADGRYGLAQFRAAKAPFLAEALRSAGKARVVAWGAGQTGRRLVRALEVYGVRAACFVDIDPEKLGRSARGVPIVTSDALDAARDVVVVGVGARGAREVIRAELAQRGFREGVDAWFGA